MSESGTSPSGSKKAKNNQLVGNIGLFYICYELSKRGWNCLPTTRNAKGVDVVVYSQDGRKKYTIQAKSLSGKNPVPFGSNPNLLADFVIICRNVFDQPEIFIMKSREVKRRWHEGKNEKGQVSYWLEPSAYEQYRDKWGKIGMGY